MQFKDPFLPHGYSPFNIQAIGDWLYVLYAKVGPDGKDDKGVGNGFVSIFSTDGSFVKRFATRDQLQFTPGGIAKAPAGFFDDTDNDAKSTNSNSKLVNSSLIQQRYWSATLAMERSMYTVPVVISWAS
ncbi:MAG: hypothetical protein WDO19_32335 [Bacteroidota bacterium]